ncbi:MAG: radical SAM family heme chaperone HemW [Synergistaceae bacterium]
MKNKSKRNNPFQPPNGGLSLYIHVPFCERKCNYCSFYSKVLSNTDMELWLNSLKIEMEYWKKRIGVATINTCYIGGGTPSVLRLSDWNDLISALEKNFSFSSNTEVTIEANPNSLTAEQLLCWRDWRVTRVSIGVQSFDDAELSFMGRLHNSYQAYDAISSTLASGFSVNTDFIFGLPYQTFKNWGRTLKDATKLGVHHISLYQLSIEKGTPWEKLDEKNLSDGYYPYRWAQWYLPQKGFYQYEISNFSLSGNESRHNINYWTGGNYLGLGPSASGYIDGWRYTNITSIDKYSKILTDGKLPVELGERLDTSSSARESAILMLRMKKGINKAEFEKKYGNVELYHICNILKKFPSKLYCIDDEYISLSNEGMRVANIIWRELV